MLWTLDAEEAYLELPRRLDSQEFKDILRAVVECVLEWASSGPPSEAEYDETAQLFVCDIPGTPVVAEYMTTSYTSPPTIQVRRFRWVP